MARKKIVKTEREEVKQEELRVKKSKGGRRKLWCESCQENVLNEKGKCAKCESINYEIGHELGKGDLFEK